MPRLSKIGAAALAAFGWTGLNTVSASYLVVAGGGGGGDGYGGGGGAGGYLTGTTSLDPIQSYTVTVGAGGAGSTSFSSTGNQGSNSVFNAITSTGGGGGGSANDVLNSSTSIGANGGSGGGGAANASGGTVTRAGGSGNTPSTSPSQGNNGGSGVTDSATYRAAGGGGGSFAVGSNGTSSVAGAGGAGTSLSISGASVTYAGGGGGGGFGVTQGAGGTGGGGAGGVSTSTTPVAGTANLGGGGGGGADGTTFNGASGGSGVVIISYSSPQKFGGGVVTTSGANTIHTFTTSGTLSPLSSLTANFLVVAGGGSGADYGGGGAGGLRSTVTNTGGGGSLESTLTIDTNSIYLVTVGAGGTGGIIGANGSNSVFFSITSTGGGRGANNTTPTVNGSSGGSGGGGRWTGGTGGAGTANQGFAGGAGGSQTTSYPAGGGGGAGAVGGNGTTGGSGGNGGAGVASSISGSSVTYAGGGGGGCAPDPNGVGGSGGSGGGGTGGTGGSGTTAGTANTGGGGGGAGSTGSSGGSGGSGIVIISYAGSTQLMAGGTVTVAGGNVIHTFTSSGYLTPLTLVGNSLRFRSSASAYLNRTPTTAGNRKTWTWSGWVKRGDLVATSGYLLNTSIAGISAAAYIYFSSNTINYWDGSMLRTSTQVFRDPSAWYHLIVAFDSTQATANNRVRMYVNGVEITSFSTLANPSLNYDSYINSVTAHYLSGTGSSAFDGYMTEINFIDGQALTPNSFGTFNQYGVWQPIRYGGSYGTNGFYLPFNANATSYAGSFNGSSQFLYLGGQSNFAFGTGDFTVEFYINANTFSNTPIIYDARPVGSNGAYSLIYVDTTGALLYYVDSALRITASKTMRINTWNHVAVVRSGTTTTLYLNGVAQGTYSDTTNYLIGASRPIIGVSTNSTNYLDGYLSNLRVVKGTAVYTTNFTPSTTPLTAITNTQLLTLQNATIVDNSTNAFSITNSGTVTTAQTYPLAISVFNDQGPAGNNWTPNNISGVSGSTLDYMTDVPTLTSATTANYCVLNPLTTTAGTYSNANLRYVGASSYRRSNATISVSTGKWYWEVTLGNAPFSPRASNSQNNAFGFGLSTVFNSTTNITSVTDAVVLADSGYYKNFSGSFTDGGTAFSSGDTLAVAVDLDANTFTFYRNNTQITTGTIGGVAGRELVPIIISYDGVYGVMDCNFGQRPFSYTPPSGFLALNTFNL